MTTFEDVTELAGSSISSEQLYRMYNRYSWTADLSKGCDVLEVACGAGQGVGLVARQANSIQAGDFSEAILARASSHYGSRFTFTHFDAQAIPFEDESFDVVAIHEALYYLPDANLFVAEANRVLRPGGRILLTNSNKDLFDFNPSPHSTFYHGVVELKALFDAHGYQVEFWGAQPLNDSGLAQKAMRIAKLFAVKFGLIPKTMRGKQLLKRLVFGKQVLMPAEILPEMSAREELASLPSDQPSHAHKIIYCVAKDADTAAKQYEED